MLTRAQLAQAVEARHRHDRNLLAALPALETLWVDPEIAEAPSLAGLCCAYFEGYERRDPPALLAVALERDRLPTVRWLNERPVSTPRLGSAVGEALARALRQLGQSQEPASDLGRRFMAGLRPLGIDRGQRTYQRDDWNRSLTAMEDRVAEALARCLVPLFDPNPVSGPVEVAYYPLGCANNPASSHTPGLYPGGHGHSLRRAA